MNINKLIILITIIIFSLGLLSCNSARTISKLGHTSLAKGSALCINLPYTSLKG